MNPMGRGQNGQQGEESQGPRMLLPAPRIEKPMPTSTVDQASCWGASGAKVVMMKPLRCEKGDLPRAVGRERQGEDGGRGHGGGMRWWQPGRAGAGGGGKGGQR